MISFQKNTFPKIIPQLDYDKYATWEYFVLKAAKGSNHAEEIIQNAESYLIREIAGNKYLESYRYISDIENVKIILEKCPYSSMQSIMDQLYRDDYTQRHLRSMDRPFNDFDHYCGLWKHGIVVSRDELVFDAVFHIFHNWSFDEFKRLTDKSINNENSLAIVARMLMVLITYCKLKKD